MSEIPTCKVEGCERSSKERGAAKGYCGLHYSRLKNGVALDAPIRATKSYKRSPGVRELEAAGLAPVRLCKVDGCEKSAYGPDGGAKGYCRAHYCKLRKYGDATVVIKVRNTCSIDDCDAVVEGHGLCTKHYKRMKRHGSTEAPPRIAPNKGKGIRQLEAAGVLPKRECKADGCQRWDGEPGAARGYCSLHRQRLMKIGDLYTLRRKRNTCSVGGCEAPVSGHGHCWKHRMRVRRYGSPELLHPSRMSPDGMKWCPKCQAYRLLDDFSRSSASKGGRQSRCKDCFAETKAAWRSRNPGYRSPGALTEEFRERNRRYSRRWRKENPDKVRAASALRRARRRTSTTEYFKPSEVFERDCWTCGLCSAPIDRTLTYPHPMSVSLDHKMPLSKGGEHSRANTQAAHLTCNLRKHDKVIEHQAALF